MIGFHLVFIFGVSFLLFPCEGRITWPPVGTQLTFLPGSNESITWTFNVTSKVVSRTWSFTSTDGLRIGTLGLIPFDSQPIPQTDTLPRVKIIKPATLVLNNVSQSHDGRYHFVLDVERQEDFTSDVRVFIAKKPNVTFSCPSVFKVNEGDNFTCVCRGENGNPPANVTWSKDDKQIGGTGTENQTLTPSNVNGTHNGTYTCEARSHANDVYADKKYIEVIVIPNSKPTNTHITLKPREVVLGEEVIIECTSRGVPVPWYRIIHNDTNIVRNGSTHTIFIAKWSDAGTYKCLVWNKLGNDSDSDKLTVVGQITTTPTISSTSQAAPSTTIKGTVGTPPEKSSDTNIGLIVGIIIGVLAFLVIAGIVLYCYKSKEKDGRNRANIDPVPGNHYELESEEPGPGDGAYDTVGPVGASGSKSKPPAGNTLPPVYAAVDKNNRQGNTLYASLDTEALKTSRASKKEPDRPPQAEYAHIDFGKSAPKADLV